MKLKSPKEGLPVWFRADQTFSSNGMWFFGSRSGLHIGPYGDRNIATEKGLRVVSRLNRLKSDKERLHYVRKVLRDEWKSIKKQSRGSSSDADLKPPLQSVRKGESAKTWFRAGRFHESEGVWFFDTREGIEVGPFETRKAAVHHERRLVAILAKAKTAGEAHSTIYEYKHRPAKDIRLTSIG